jgi:hypothetical protein
MDRIAQESRVERSNINNHNTFELHSSDGEIHLWKWIILMDIIDMKESPCKQSRKDPFHCTKGMHINTSSQYILSIAFFTAPKPTAATGGHGSRGEFRARTSKEIPSGALLLP